MPINPLDYFDAFSYLHAEEQELQETVRRFVKENLLSNVATWWQEGRFPTQLIPQLGEMGLLGADLPQAYGAAEVGPVSYGLIMEALEWADSGLRSFASVQGGLVMHAIYEFGSEEQKRAWLPQLAAGKKVGCFGLTEPDAGSDPNAMRTTARRSGTGWVLEGNKLWITNAPIADLAVVWAKDEQSRINGFLVEAGTAGLTREEIPRKASMRCSVTGALHFQEVFVDEDHHLPLAHSLRAPLTCLDSARYGIVWGSIGAAEACLQEALEYAKQRVTFGRPIATRQLIQERLVAMASSLGEMRLTALQLGRLKEADRLDPAQISLAKRNNARKALEIARMARSILAANGITLDYQAIRHMLNLETVDTYEGTYDVHTLIAGQALTGSSAF